MYIFAVSISRLPTFHWGLEGRGGGTLLAAGEIIIVQCICKDSSTQYPYYLLITEHNNRTIMCQV